jgi:hypothetical protein
VQFPAPLMPGRRERIKICHRQPNGSIRTTNLVQHRDSEHGPGYNDLAMTGAAIFATHWLTSQTSRKGIETRQLEARIRRRECIGGKSGRGALVTRGAREIRTGFDRRRIVSCQAFTRRSTLALIRRFMLRNKMSHY